MSQQKAMDDPSRIGRADADSLEKAQAEREGVDFSWHFGRVTRLGCYALEGGVQNGRSVTVLWEEGGLSCQQGSINDEQWEIFRLAFMTTGMITVLSDESGEGWMYDYRFLEVVR